MTTADGISGLGSAYTGSKQVLEIWKAFRYSPKGNMALMSSAGVIMVLLTEKGFFRGWLWAFPQTGRSK